MSPFGLLKLFAVSFFLLLWGLPSRAQTGTVTLPIQDKSSAGSPLSISGSVELTETTSANTVRVSITDDILARNISDKIILTIVFWIDVTPSHGAPHRFVRQYECFFAPDVIRPGDEHGLSQPGRGQREDEEPFEPGNPPKQPFAEARAMYVEFIDGEVFGDKQVGKNIRALRKIAWHHLKDLNSTYEARGEAGFIRQLEEKVDPPEVDTLIANVRQTRQTRGVAAAIGQIRNMLAFAEERKIALKGKE